ncbi:DNA-3-methyladenine glycosylase I [Campylobacter sp. MIT 99-7217]|uniref:DNA-3-methyladenine glycosylase I n=1 Tax=Campylobacter sp. MIT 99-7217 TaxID=535091 RepID=UPI00115B7E7C|nr:DNA-3-methyladenine glycosylase I [Campylobacter sp. MIT 99-7217]TQR33146.1 DNA-3-methyladenine glycosylase I [Campylobacter sp. MIT 99-7217]
MGYCDWSLKAIYKNYHDNEWGVPVYDDLKQFEHLSMEVMQCGLSWQLMLKKREIFRKCFADFDFEKIALFDEDKLKQILSTQGMIASKAKILAIINNARVFKKIRAEFGSFSAYLWAFTENKVLIYRSHAKTQVPASNDLSTHIAKELKKHGFKFLGPITVYSHLQACGIINDHDPSCPCYKQIIENFDITYL